MEANKNPRNKAKDIVISILAGIGIVVGAFLLGTVLLWALELFLVGLLIPSCRESCLVMVLSLSLLCDGLIAIIAGIIGGRKIYKHIKGESLMNLPKQLSAWFMAIYFLLSGLHGVAFALFPAAIWWQSVGNGLWGFESFLALCVGVLIITGK